MKKNRNIIEWIIFLAFAVIGLVFLIVGVLFYQDISKKEKKWIQTEATIVDIQSAVHLDGDRSYNVVVEFQVESKTYRSDLSEWNSTMKIGKKVSIYYNPNNPYEIIGNGFSFTYVIFMMLGSIFEIIGLIPLVHLYGKNLFKRKLKKNGRKIEATIDDVTLKMNYSVNGRHPYILKCSFVDPTDGKIYFFKSGHIWYNVEELINQYEIETIPVYIEPNHPQKYIVDIEIFDQYIGN